MCFIKTRKKGGEKGGGANMPIEETIRKKLRKKED